MGCQKRKVLEMSQCTTKLVLSVLLASMCIITDPTNAEGDTYYGAFVGNFENRFHGIKGEVMFKKRRTKKQLV